MPDGRLEYNFGGQTVLICIVPEGIILPPITQDALMALLKQCQANAGPITVHHAIHLIEEFTPVPFYK